MIFTGGVCFMRLRSAPVKGCASESAPAAFPIASMEIGRSILLEIIVLLMLGCPPCRNNPNTLVALVVSHKQQNLPFRHTDDDETLLTVIFPIVIFAILKAVNGKRVVKHRFRQVEVHAVSFEIRVGLGIGPSEYP
jgi:hypothetical protein